MKEEILNKLKLNLENFKIISEFKSDNADEKERYRLCFETEITAFCDILNYYYFKEENLNDLDITEYIKMIIEAIVNYYVKKEPLVLTGPIGNPNKIIENVIKKMTCFNKSLETRPDIKSLLTASVLINNLHYNIYKNEENTKGKAITT